MYETNRDEAGSALIMVLVVLVFVAVVVLSTLTYSVTSVKSSNQALIPARTRLYDADSAVQAAIQYVKLDQKNGGSLGKDTGRPCPPSPGADPASTFVYPGSSAVAALNAAVNSSQTTLGVTSATNFPTSGQFVIVVDSEDMLVTAGQGTTSWTVTRGYLGTPAAAHTNGSAARIGITVNICPQVDSFNLDGNARAVLLTLAGPTSGEGIDFAKNVDDTINGDVWTNSDISLGSSASTTVNGGKLWSWNTNSCSGSITAPVGKDCSANVTFGFTTLSGSLTSSQSSLTVVGNVKFPASGQYVVEIDSEEMLVTAGQGTNTWTITRGYGGTTAAAHANGARVSFMPKTGLDPADPLLGHVADWQPAAAPGAIQVPSGCTLSPGVYLSGTALTTQTNACNAGVTLSPGVYYLNFPAADDTWTISNDVTGACDGTGQGAQLVFANESKLAMSGSSQDLTLCGRRVSPTAPQIAMTYLKTSTASGPDTNVILRPSANPTSTGTLTWTNLPNVVYSGSGELPARRYERHRDGKREQSRRHLDRGLGGAGRAIDPVECGRHLGQSSGWARRNERMDLPDEWREPAERSVGQLQHAACSRSDDSRDLERVPLQ